jgi:hypothetical protein
MKKTLYESLVDYDVSMLSALAEVRGAMLTGQHQLTAARELADQLIAPTSVAIAVADLSPAEAEALAAVQMAGGWMESRRFARQFGTARAMGSGRLARERPWQSPTNAAEGLWYRGLIYKGFRQTDMGVVEVVYIPHDLLALLPAAPASRPVPSLGTAAVPAHVQPANADLVEDLFGALVHTRNHRVRLNADGELSPKDLQAIDALRVHPVGREDAPSDDHLVFVLHLCRTAELTVEHQKQLTVNQDPARAWLRASPMARLADLQEAWLDDTGWNDLWHVPSLRLQATGWMNDPLLARRAVLRFLAGCRPGAWHALDDLTAIIKSDDPDFQRPDGDYTTWYIHDPKGQPLMSFEHWDEVEGALIRHLVSGLLHWLGVTDIGYEEDPGLPAAFRLAETGRHLVQLVSAPSAEDSPPEGEQPPSGEKPSTDPDLIVEDDFTVRVASGTSLYERFQLARFAEFVGREPGWVSYRLSPGSLATARRQGVTAEQANAFLMRTTAKQVPAGILDTVQRWHAGDSAVRLEQVALLRVEQPEVLTHLRHDVTIGPLLGDVLDAQTVLVPRPNVKQVRRWLVEHGYLADKGPKLK